MREREGRVIDPIWRRLIEKKQFKKSRKSPKRVSDILLYEKIYVPRSRRRETWRCLLKGYQVDREAFEVKKPEKALQRNAARYSADFVPYCRRLSGKRTTRPTLKGYLVLRVGGWWPDERTKELRRSGERFIGSSRAEPSYSDSCETRISFAYKERRNDIFR